MQKRLIAALLVLGFVLGLLPVAIGAVELEFAAPSAILMDAATGQILYEKNDHERLRPASVTKVMTLLLVMEALERGQLSWDSNVTASAAAAAKGGSQVYLKEGEQMTMDEMLKSVVVASANDCATALAEAVAGSEEVFVSQMNQRAQELGMKDTNFVNCTGLDDGPDAGEHLTTAFDIAVMSRELLKHEAIRKYTTIWMDTVRDGQFGLSNTNKLVRFYNGTTGLKTGFTQAAGYCLASSAMRDDMELIAVVMNCKSSTDRFESAKTLMDYGFATYALVNPTPTETLAPVKVVLGESASIQPIMESTESVLIEKSLKGSVTTEIVMEESVTAPVEKGQKLGTLTVKAGDKNLATVAIVAPERVEKLTWLQLTARILKNVCLTA